MKTIILVCLVLSICMCSAKKHKKNKEIKWDNIKDADMLNKMIRNRGTYIY